MSVQDGLAACAAGVDALGLNFFPKSPRYLSAEDAKTICSEISVAYPDVQKIGLFVDAPVEQVRGVIDLVALDMLQFHGDESPEYCQQFDMPYIKVLGVSPDSDVAAFEARFDQAWGLILDTHDPTLKGGTGRSFDWSLWPAQTEHRLVLAGGLNAENVAQGIRQTQPFGVDVAGGVEGNVKGVKDHSKMKLFIENCKNG